MRLSDENHLRFDLRVAIYLVCMVLTCLYSRLCVAKAQYIPHFPDLVMIFIISGIVILGLVHKNKSVPQLSLTVIVLLNAFAIPFVLKTRHYYLYEGWKYLTALSVLFLAAVNFRPFLKQFWAMIGILFSSLITLKIVMELGLNWLIEQSFYKTWFDTGELISINNLLTFSVAYCISAMLCVAYLQYIWRRRKIIYVSRTDLLIVAGSLAYSLIHLLRGYVVFRGYADSEMYYLLETFSIVPGAMWILAFDSRGDRRPESNRYLFWKIQAVVAGIVVFASALVIPQDGTLLHILFIVSSALVIEALVLMAALFYLLFRESVDQSREIIRLSNRMGSIMKSAHDAIFVVNSEGIIEDVNLGAERIARRHRAKLVNSKWKQLIKPLDAEQKDGMLEDESKLYRLAEDDLSVFKMNGVSISLGGRRLDVYALQDMTRLKQEIVRNEHLRAQLVRGQKMEAAAGIARGMAHDFNNFLTGIRGAAQLLERHIVPGTKERKYVTMILESADEASLLVHQLLDSVRVDRQNARVVSVSDVVKQACKLLIPQLINVKLTTDFQPEMPQLWVDPAELIRCVLNLGRNAIQAMEGKGRLKISIYSTDPGSIPVPLELSSRFSSGQAITIEVVDSGPGIPVNVRDRIFEPYFTTKQSGEGTGLGLGITYGIVKSYDGFMTLESAIGQGTRFFMYFPEYVEDSESSDPSS